jgi:hypothetical protein
VTKGGGNGEIEKTVKLVKKGCGKKGGFFNFF